MEVAKKDIAPLVLTGIIAAIFAFIISGVVFKSPAHNSSAATAPTISSSFPDTSHNPTYTAIFNNQSIDPARPVSVGSSSNSTPFNSQGQ